MKTVQNACEMSGAGAKTRVWRKHTRMSCRPCEQKRPKKKIQSIRVSHIPRKQNRKEKMGPVPSGLQHKEVGKLRLKVFSRVLRIVHSLNIATCRLVIGQLLKTTRSDGGTKRGHAICTLNHAGFIQAIDELVVNGNKAMWSIVQQSICRRISAKKFKTVGRNLNSLRSLFLSRATGRVLVVRVINCMLTFHFLGECFEVLAHCFRLRMPLFCDDLS